MTTLDRIRQVTVAACAVLAIVGSFIGSGAAGGTPIAEAAGGALAADATLVAPGTGAFQIWYLIYVGLVAYAVWQFVPAQASAERHRRLGWWVAASLLLNAAWILSIQFGQLWLSVPVIVVLLVVLGIAFRIAYSTVSTSPLDAVFTDGTIGLYLGWVCVATVANVTAWLVDLGFDGLGISPVAWSVAVVVVTGLVGTLLAVVGNGRLTPAISLSWGLVWIAIARLSGAPQSTLTAIAALVVVAGVLVVTAVFRGRRPSHHPARVASPR